MARLLWLLPVLVWVCAAQSAPDGEALYQKTCARCHDAGAERAPNRAALKLMSPENIRLTLVSGSMSRLGFTLSSAEIAVLAESLTGKRLSTEKTAAPGLCTAP